jgi:hypothetical protein
MNVVGIFRLGGAGRKMLFRIERGMSVTPGLFCSAVVSLVRDGLIPPFAKTAKVVPGPDHPQITAIQRANLLAHEVSLVPCDRESD